MCAPSLSYGAQIYTKHAQHSRIGGRRLHIDAPTWAYLKDAFVVAAFTSVSKHFVKLVWLLPRLERSYLRISTVFSRKDRVIYIESTLTLSSKQCGNFARHVNAITRVITSWDHCHGCRQSIAGLSCGISCIRHSDRLQHTLDRKTFHETKKHRRRMSECDMSAQGDKLRVCEAPWYNCSWQRLLLTWFESMETRYRWCNILCTQMQVLLLRWRCSNSYRLHALALRKPHMSHWGHSNRWMSSFINLSQEQHMFSVFWTILKWNRFMAS